MITLKKNIIILLLIPFIGYSQDRLDLTISEKKTDAVAIFNAEKMPKNADARIFIYSSLANLEFTSNTDGIVDSRSEIHSKGLNKYILYIINETQIITIKPNSVIKGGEIVFKKLSSRDQTKEYDIEPAGDNRIGSLILYTNPSGANAEDKAKILKFTTPIIQKEIQAGLYYKFLITKDGYFDTTVTLFVPEGEINRDTIVDLRSKYGFFKFSPYCADSEVEIFKENDSLAYSVNPKALSKLLVGTYSLSLKKKYYKPYLTLVSIGSAETLMVSPILTPDFAFLKLSMKEPSLDSVSVRVVGMSNDIPGFDRQNGVFPLRLGTNEIRLRYVGYQDTAFTIEAKTPGDTLNLRNFEMLSMFRPGYITVYSDVKGKISIDKEFVGEQSVLAFKKNPGIRSISVLHPAFGQVTKNISLSAGERSELYISLLPSQRKAQWAGLIPGAGQFYKGEGFKGYLYLSLTLGGIAASVAANYFYEDNLASYKTYVNQYKNISTSGSLNETKENIIYYSGQANMFKGYRDYAIAGTAGIYLWSVLDNWIFDPDFGYTEDMMPRQAFPLLSRPIKSNAFWLSGIPGASQIYKESAVKGFFSILVFTAGVSAIYYYNDVYESKRSDMILAKSKYLTSSTFDESVETKTILMSASSQSQDALTNRQNALLLTGIWYSLNVLDGLLTPPPLGYQKGMTDQKYNSGKNSFFVFGVTIGAAISYWAHTKYLAENDKYNLAKTDYTNSKSLLEMDYLKDVIQYRSENMNKYLSLRDYSAYSAISIAGIGILDMLGTFSVFDNSQNVRLTPNFNQYSVGLQLSMGVY